MSRLRDRVVAITGASAGIGRAVAVAAAAEGAAVVVLARRADRLEALASEITGRGGRALVVAGDVTREADLERLVTESVRTFGRLDVMVCNAGIVVHGTLDDTPVDAMRRLVDVNVMGTLYAARAALVVFRRQGHGHIIAVSSIVGRRGVGGASVYSATKAAQVGLIEGLRAEFAGSALHASIVFPVSTETELREAERRDFGRDVEGHGPRQSADLVARAIVSCMVHPTAEVYPHPTSRALAMASVIAPSLTDRAIRRFGRRVTPPKPSR